MQPYSRGRTFAASFIETPPLGNLRLGHRDRGRLVGVVRASKTWRLHLEGDLVVLLQRDGPTLVRRGHLLWIG